MSALDNVCDVCHSKSDWVGVHSSSVAPMSFASCVECLKRTAELEGTFHYLYDMVGTKGEGLAEWVKALNTWQDDKYMTWNEWVAWRRDPVRVDDLDKKAADDLEAFNKLCEDDPEDSD